MDQLLPQSLVGHHARHVGHVGLLRGDGGRRRLGRVDGPSAEQPTGVATPSYRLLLAEEQAAQLRIGSRVGEAQDGTLRLGLSALRHLVGRSSANRRLLVGGYGCSHGHLEEARSRQKKRNRNMF